MATIDSQTSAADALHELFFSIVDSDAFRMRITSILEERFAAHESRIITYLRGCERSSDPFGAETLLSESELAAKLHCCRRTVRRLELRGKLPAPIRIGSSKRWRSKEIEKWLTMMQTNPKGLPTL